MSKTLIGSDRSKINPTMTPADTTKVNMPTGRQSGFGLVTGAEKHSIEAGVERGKINFAGNSHDPDEFSIAAARVLSQFGLSVIPTNALSDSQKRNNGLT